MLKAESRDAIDMNAGLSVTELFERIVNDPKIATPLLERFRHYSDRHLYQLFKERKRTLVDVASDWILANLTASEQCTTCPATRLMTVRYSLRFFPKAWTISGR